MSFFGPNYSALSEILLRNSVQPLAIGIDFGTTNSSIAVCYEDGTVAVIPNGLTGHRKTPSCVAFDDGERIIGQSAMQTVFDNPENFIFDLKRILGRNFNDPEIRQNRARWPFKVVDGGPQGPVIAVEELGGIKNYSPIEVTAIILSELKNYASQYLGQPVTTAVITVPQTFKDAQRDATRAAGKLAGLEIVDFISDPIAAALGHQVASGTKKQIFLVFDFGGGTLDVSVLTFHDQSNYAVLATESYDLGGKDFDDRLLEHYKNNFKTSHGVDLKDYPIGLAKLRLQCEIVRNSLVGSTSARVSVASIIPNVNFKAQTSREEFEELCADLLTNIMNPVQKALHTADVPKNGLDFILLVGGNSRIPKVQEILKNFFGNVPLRFNSNMDLTAVAGAAIQMKILLEKAVKDNAERLKSSRVADAKPKANDLTTNLDFLRILKDSMPNNNNPMVKSQKPPTFPKPPPFPKPLTLAKPPTTPKQSSVENGGAILSGNGKNVRALARNWQTETLYCADCKDTLDKENCISLKDKSVCLKCHKKNFDPQCTGCQLKIDTTERQWTCADKHFHEACFICYVCKTSLASVGVFSKENQIYCDSCFNTTFGKNCHSCSGLIRVDTKTIDCSGTYYHANCFVCAACRRTLGDEPCRSKENDIYCAQCYDEKYGLRCTKCSLIIKQSSITYEEKPFHLECFLCFNCNTQLAGQKFLLNDKTYFCVACHIELFAKRCAECKLPITALNGETVQYFTSKDQNYHIKCFH